MIFFGKRVVVAANVRCIYKRIGALVRICDAQVVGSGEHWGQGTRNMNATGGEARNGKPLEEAWLQVKSEEGNIDGTV